MKRENLQRAKTTEDCRNFACSHVRPLSLPKSGHPSFLLRVKVDSPKKNKNDEIYELAVERAYLIAMLPEVLTKRLHLLNDITSQF